MAGGRRIHGPRALRIIGRVFLVVGLAGLVAAAGFAVLELRSGRTAEADGIIIGANYGPVVQFTTRDGGIVRFGSAIRSSFLGVGEHVPVVYAPDNPTNAAIDGLVGRWFLPGLLAILGGVFFLISAGLTGAAARWRRDAMPDP